jgi:hypothetical protein
MKITLGLLVIGLCGGSSALWAQSLSAQQILRKAVNAAGGEVWQSPNTLVLKGVADFTPYGRQDAEHFIHFDDYAMYRVFPPDNDEAHKANGKVRFDATYGEKPFFLLKFDGKKSAMNLSDLAKPYGKHFNWSNNFGFSIIRFADDPTFTTTLLTTDQVEGYPCFMVQITDPKKNVTTFGIDQKTFNIRLVQFTTDVGFHHRIYSDFKRDKASGFVQPTRVRLYFDGLKWMDIHWQRFAVNQPIADKIFAVD